MILERGNMWDVFGETDCFIITTNTIIKNNGALVMGRGIAAQMRDRVEDIDKFYATMISIKDRRHPGFVQGYHPVAGPVGSFQVKYAWNQAALLHLIALSTYELCNVAWYEGADYRFDLNFPGIGNGGLDREDVLPIIQQLPDNVHIWEY